MTSTNIQPPQEALSEREHEIVQLMLKGATNGEIGRKLHLTEGTVKWYNTQIFGKLGVKNRVEAIQTYQASSTLAQPPAPATRPTIAAPASMIGRASELAELTILLQSPKNRLITLLGSGGMGKSTLAFQLAHTISAHFAQGVYKIDLTALTTHQHIPAAIASALRLAVKSDQPIAPQLFAHLSNQHMLLVLDNFEHLTDDITFITALLSAAPRLWLLCTSRERLNMQEETVFRLHGLTLPAEHGNEEITLENDAIQLFLLHAQRVQPNLPRTPANLACIANICRQVDGMPLALVLAASSADMLTLQDIYNEIKGKREVLTTELRDVAARHQSITRVMDSTWIRLSALEQTVLARLSLFRAGFTREASHTIANANMRILAALHNKSLIRHDNGRYSIHELLRQYAAEQLAASGDETAAGAAHGNYYLAFLASATAVVTQTVTTQTMTTHKNQSNADYLNLIGPDFENVRMAWLWACELKNESAIAHSLASLIHFCNLGGRMGDAAQLCSTALEHVSDPILRITLVQYRAQAFTDIGAFELAFADAQHIYNHAEANGDNKTMLQMLSRQGFVLRRLTRLVDVEKTLARALALAREIKDAHAEADLLFHYGMNQYSQGKHLDSLTTQQTALQLIEQHNFTDLVAIQTLYGIAHSYMSVGLFISARQNFLKSLVLARQAGNLLYESECLNMLGWTYCRPGSYEFDRSQQYHEQAFAVSSKAQMPWQARSPILGIGCAKTAFGDYANAYKLLKQSLQHMLQLTYVPEQCMAHKYLGVLYRDLGLYELALEHHLASEALMLTHNTIYILYKVQAEIARDRIHLGLFTPELLLQLLDVHSTATQRSPVQVINLNAALCEAYDALGNYPAVLQSAHESIAYCRERQLVGLTSKYSHWLGRAQIALGQTAQGFETLHEALASAEAKGHYRLQIDIHRSLQQHYAAQNHPTQATKHEAAAKRLIANIADNLREHPELLHGLARL